MRIFLWKAPVAGKTKLRPPCSPHILFTCAGRTSRDENGPEINFLWNWETREETLPDLTTLPKCASVDPFLLIFLFFNPSDRHCYLLSLSKEIRRAVVVRLLTHLHHLPFAFLNEFLLRLLGLPTTLFSTYLCSSKSLSFFGLPCPKIFTPSRLFLEQCCCCWWCFFSWTPISIAFFISAFPILSPYSRDWSAGFRPPPLGFLLLLPLLPNPRNHSFKDASLICPLFFASPPLVGSELERR